MLLLILFLSHHIPQEYYLRCKDYDWLTQGALESELSTPYEKSEMILNWINHTDPKCFT
jgi:hypothetical protein